MILLALITPFFMNPTDKSKMGNMSSKKPTTMHMLAFILAMGVTILNIYCLYSYTKDLQESQCNCVRDSLANLFGFVFYYIRISVLLLMVGLLISLITMLVS
jgi:hypothetical protein